MLNQNDSELEDSTFLGLSQAARALALAQAEPSYGALHFSPMPTPKKDSGEAPGSEEV
jgi:hypothetical protein